jgi:5'-nucleotidase
MIIAMDVDGTVAKTIDRWLALYNLDYGDHLKTEDITSWNIEKFMKPECGTCIFEYLIPSLYDHVLPEIGAKKFVDFARASGYRVVFVTSVYKEAGAKYEWLMRNDFFAGVEKPKYDYVEASDKSLIHADILIDDGLHNISSFPGFGLIFDQPWNRESWTNTITGTRVVGFNGATEWLRQQIWIDSEKE